MDVTPQRHKIGAPSLFDMDNALKTPSSTRRLAREAERVLEDLKKAVMPKVSSPSSPTLRGKGGGGQSNSSHMRCLSERVLELESRLKTPAAARSGLYRSIARALDSSTAARTLSSPFAGAAPKASPDLPPSIAAGATLATNLAPNWRRSDSSLDQSSALDISADAPKPPTPPRRTGPTPASTSGPRADTAAARGWRGRTSFEDRLEQAFQTLVQATRSLDGERDLHDAPPSNSKPARPPRDFRDLSAADGASSLPFTSSPGQVARGAPAGGVSGRESRGPLGPQGGGPRSPGVSGGGVAEGTSFLDTPPGYKDSPEDSMPRKASRLMGMLPERGVASSAGGRSTGEEEGGERGRYGDPTDWEGQRGRERERERERDDMGYADRSKDRHGDMEVERGFESGAGTGRRGGLVRGVGLPSNSGADTSVDDSTRGRVDEAGGGARVRGGGVAKKEEERTGRGAEEGDAMVVHLMRRIARLEAGLKESEARKRQLKRENKDLKIAASRQGSASASRRVSGEEERGEAVGGERGEVKEEGGLGRGAEEGGKRGVERGAERGDEEAERRREGVEKRLREELGEARNEVRLAREKEREERRAKEALEGQVASLRRAVETKGSGTEETKRLSDTVADLSDRLAKAQKEKEFLQQELRDARSSLRDADARAARDATALEELLHKLRGKGDEMERMTREVRDARAQRDALEKENAKLREGVDALQKAQEKLGAVGDELTRTRQELASVRDRLAGETEARSKAEEEAKRVRERLEEARGRIDQARVRLQGADSDTRHLRDENARLKADVARAVEAEGMAMQRAEGLEGERDRARAEVKRLSGVLSEERTTRQLVEDRLGRTLDELDRVGRQLRDAEKERDSHSARLAKALPELEEKTKIIDEVEAQINTLEESLMQTAEDNRGLMSQLEGVKKELADLVQQRGVLEDRIRDLERKHAEANKALGLKREECEALTSRLRDATSQRDALNEELEYCRDENRGLEGMVKGYEEQVQTMAEQAEALQGQLVERDRQLAAYKNVDLEKLQANLDAALGRAAQLEDMYKEKYGEAAALRQKLRAAGVRE